MVSTREMKKTDGSRNKGVINGFHLMGSVQVATKPRISRNSTFVTQRGKNYREFHLLRQ